MHPSGIRCILFPMSAPPASANRHFCKNVATVGRRSFSAYIRENEQLEPSLVFWAQIPRQNFKPLFLNKKWVVVLIKEAGRFHAALDSGNLERIAALPDDVGFASWKASSSKLPLHIHKQPIEKGNAIAVTLRMMDGEFRTLWILVGEWPLLLPFLNGLLEIMQIWPGSGGELKIPAPQEPSSKPRRRKPILPSPPKRPS